MAARKRKSPPITEAAEFAEHEADHSPKTAAERAATQYRHEHGLPSDAPTPYDGAKLEPTPAALMQREHNALLTQLALIERGLFEVAKAVREVGFAIIAQEPLRAAPATGGLSPAETAKAARRAAGAAVSLPPASPTAQDAPAQQAPPPAPSKAQGEHGGSPKQPAIPPAEAKPQPPPPQALKPGASATLQQAQQAVLNFSAKWTAPVCAERLAKVGVQRVSLIPGTDAEKKAKYAEVVAVLGG